MDYSKQESLFLALQDDDTKSSRSDASVVNSRKHVIVRKDGKKKNFITAFETNYGNTFVMNAKTNQPYDVRYGSKHEDGLFSVILATGETGQTPITLFYDNPEQYERHFRISLSKEAKHRWYKKQRVYNISRLST